MKSKKCSAAKSQSADEQKDGQAPPVRVAMGSSKARWLKLLQVTGFAPKQIRRCQERLLSRFDLLFRLIFYRGQTAIISYIRYTRSNFSMGHSPLGGGLKVAISSSLQGWTMERPSLSTTFTPSDKMLSSRLAMPSSSRFISSTFSIPLCASASRNAVCPSCGALVPCNQAVLAAGDMFP